MSNDQKNILIQTIDGQTLARYSYDQREKAFSYAEELENMGIEVTLSSPSLPESLLISLGANTKEREHLKNEIEEEIDSHADNCCNAHPVKNH